MSDLIAGLIVRDEAKNIQDCLDSVLPITNRAIIIDTGSRDATISLIEEHPIEAEIHTTEWVNFGYNRTHLFEVAKDKSDWLLLLDADDRMVLEGGVPDLDVDAPEVWELRQTDGWEYWMPRLVNNHLDWEFVGSTHEYLRLKETGTIYSRKKQQNISYRHLATGGSRSKKFYRDIALLLEEYHQDRSNARAVFYLARSYDDIGQIEEAIKWYEMRASMGGWEEERWWAEQRAAALYERFDTIKAIGLLWVAWSKRPWRAEPLARIAEIATKNRWPHLAEQATQIKPPLPENDILFIQRSDYLEQ